MNAHSDPRTLATTGHPIEDAPAAERADTSRRRLPFWRAPLRSLSIARLVCGGRVTDGGRLPRYLVVAMLGIAGLWAPITAYLMLAPERYSSQMALILPGAGSQSSVNLSEIGQASSAAASPYSSSAVSPTVTYKNLLMSRVTAARAAEELGLTADVIGKPRVKLLDQTSLIEFSMTGASPEEAHTRTGAMFEALLAELDELRSDEIERREASTQQTIRQYQVAAEAVRAEITALQTRSGLISEQQYKDVVAGHEQVRKQVGDLEAELNKHDEQIAKLSRLLDIAPQRAAETLRLHTDTEFEALAIATSQEAAAYALVADRFGPQHPKVVNTRLRFSGAKSRMIARGVSVTGFEPAVLERHVDIARDGERVVLLSRLVSLVADREGLVGELTALRSTLDDGGVRVRQLVEVAAELGSLQRDYKVAEAVFASALARANTSKADVFASYPMVQVAEPATMPWSPSSPKVIIAIAAGVASTMMLLFSLLLGWIRRPLIEKITSFAGDANA